MLISKSDRKKVYKYLFEGEWCFGAIWFPLRNTENRTKQENSASSSTENGEQGSTIV